MVKEIKENWNLIQIQTIETLNNFQDKDLATKIFKLPKTLLFVKTKENSILWNIKHTMWHCGQMAILTDALYISSKQSVAGYIFIVARNMKSVLSTVAKCPILKGKNTPVEVRGIESRRL